MNDTIYRQAAIDALEREKTYCRAFRDGYAPTDVFEKYNAGLTDGIKALKNLPSAQPTLHGYNIEHLELIARVLQKENLPPERVVEMLTDIGRIISIVCDEFEETLKKSLYHVILDED